MGIDVRPTSRETEFVADMRAMLRTLEDAYGGPVDVEYTTNFRPDGDYLINLVQCRPLQVQSEGAATEAPERIPADDLVLEAHGAIIGHSRVLAVHRIIYVVRRFTGSCRRATGTRSPGLWENSSTTTPRRASRTSCCWDRGAGERRCRRWACRSRSTRSARCRC